MKIAVWVPAAVLAIATFAYRYLSFGHFSNDHFLHLARAQQITMGAWPVRDFVESGLPLMSILSALAQVTLGHGLRAELLLIAAAYAIAAGLFFIVAARVSGSIWIATAAAAMPTVVYPATYSYPKLLPYAAAFVAAWYYVRNPSRLRLVVLAAVVVVGFLFRHDHGVILGVGALALVAARHGMTRDAKAAVAGFAIAGVLLVTPYVLWVERYEGVGAYIGDGMTFTQHEMEKATRRPPSFSLNLSGPLLTTAVERHGPVIHVRWVPDLSEGAIEKHEADHGLRRMDAIGPGSWQYELSSWSPSALRGLVTDSAVADTDGIDRQTFKLGTGTRAGTERVVRAFHAEVLHPRENAVAAIYYLVWLLPAAAALILVSGWRDLAPAVRSLAVMAIVVQLMMNGMMLRDPLDTRVRDVVAPAVVLLAFIAAYMWNRGAASVAPRRRGLVSGSMARIRWRAAAFALLGIMFCAAAVTGAAGEHLHDLRLASLAERAALIRQRLAYPDDAGASNSPDEGIIEYLSTCTTPDARLFMMTFAPELLFYTRRGFAAGHESLVPGFYTHDRNASLMLERLSHEDVPFVIMDSETIDAIRANYPRLIRHVDGRYREVVRFPLAVGKDFIVFADATRTPAGSFGHRGLPCFAAAGARAVRAVTDP